MTPLSVIVITRNEERNITACLESVQWADELIVVDAESKDKTIALAGKFTKKIFIEPWKGFAEAKTFGVSQSRNDWILWLDADERVTPQLSAELQSLLAGPPPMDSYSVARRAYFLGTWIKHSGWYPGRVVRLFRKDRATFSSATVHEGLQVRGSTGELRSDLLHFTDPDLSHYLEKFNRYTTLAGGQLFNEGRKFRMVDVIVRPPWLFVKMYFLRLGFLDGVAGFILAVLSSAYVFTKYAKLWEVWLHNSQQNTPRTHG